MGALSSRRTDLVPKLLRSSEAHGCGATIKLDNGDVVYVSNAQVGVLVRKWDMSGGFFKTLLKQFLWPEAVHREQRLQERSDGASIERAISRSSPRAPAVQKSGAGGVRKRHLALQFGG